MGWKIEIEKVNKLIRNGYNKLYKAPNSPLFSIFIDRSTYSTTVVAIPTSPVSPKSKIFHPLAHHQHGTSHQILIPP